MATDRIEPMSRAQPVHVRNMELRMQLTEEDMWEILRRFEALYPTAVYFRRAYKAQPAIFCRSIDEYVAALPINLSRKAKRKFLVMRVPWPEEIAVGDEQSLIGGEFPYAASLAPGCDPLYDSVAWYNFGRVVTIDWATNFPMFLPTQKVENEHARRRKPYPLIGEYRVPEGHRTNDLDTLISHSYNKNQPGTHEFMLSIKSLLRGIFTTRNIGVYDPIDGEYLGVFNNSDKSKYSIRLLKRAALVENTYFAECGLQNTVGYSKQEMPELPASYRERYVAMGASPELKAEIYLEAGRSLDGIAGLDIQTRDKVLRSFERKQKQRKTNMLDTRQT
jgi:hypothetical protein